MTREEFVSGVLEQYNVVTVLQDEEKHKIMRLRHKKIGQDIILHSQLDPVAVYAEMVQFESENLPRIFDVIPAEDGQIVLEEYIDGMTVADVLDSGLYTYDGMKNVLCGVCSALDALHRRGIVHRDVKPQNVMVEKSGRVVLIDFDAARKVSAARRDTVALGTMGYASPEQYGITQSDSRSDLYAAGVLINVMMTGKHPSESIARGKAGRIVRKCTSIQPRDRYPSARTLMNAL